MEANKPLRRRWYDKAPVLVVGGLLGDLAQKVSWLSWMGFGQQFGLESPLVLDLSIVKITFALMFKINIASIIGLAIAIFIYRKV